MEPAAGVCSDCGRRSRVGDRRVDNAEPGCARESGRPQRTWSNSLRRGSGARPERARRSRRRRGARGLARPGRGSLPGAGLRLRPFRAALRRAAPRPSNRGAGSPLTSSRGGRGAGSPAPPPARLSRTCSAGTPVLFSAPCFSQPVTARCGAS